jgi:hypothetical protein
MMTSNELRARLLKEYNYDVREENELFPFVRIIYDIKEINLNGMRYLSERLEKKKMNSNNFNNNWQAFLHGFGQWGFACFTALIILVVFGISYSDKLDTQNELLARQDMSTQFLNYSIKRSPKQIKLLQDNFNQDKVNHLKIKLLPLDSLVVIGK